MNHAEEMKATQEAADEAERLGISDDNCALMFAARDAAYAETAARAEARKHAVMYFEAVHTNLSNEEVDAVWTWLDRGDVFAALAVINSALAVVASVKSPRAKMRESTLGRGWEQKMSKQMFLADDIHMIQMEIVDGAGGLLSLYLVYMKHETEKYLLLGRMRVVRKGRRGMEASVITFLLGGGW